MVENVLTNAQMNKVFGETRYTTTGFKNANIVAQNWLAFGGPGYCAGCNGSFTLDFSHTSVGTSKGVYGVGFDFVNDGPPLFSPQYTAFIQVYEFLEAERIKYAIRLPANRALQDRIGYLLRRPDGRPTHHERRSHASFSD